MRSIALPFALAFALSLALVPLARHISIRLGYVAAPREDRWHRRPVALFGGVAIAVVLFACSAIFGLVTSLPVLVGAAALMFGTGFVDDVLSLKPSTKLVAQIALASVLLFFDYRLNWLESTTLDALLTLLWIVGLTNAFNLIDNMDGLCAGIALIVGAALLIDLLPGAAGTRAFFEARYLAILLGATGGFLVYNLHPASIFMGDSGSLLLGFSFAAVTLSAGHQAPGPIRRPVDRRGPGARAPDPDLRHHTCHPVALALGTSRGPGRARSLVASPRRDRPLGAPRRRAAVGARRRRRHPRHRRRHLQSEMVGAADRLGVSGRHGAVRRLPRRHPRLRRCGRAVEAGHVDADRRRVHVQAARRRSAARLLPRRDVLLRRVPDALRGPRGVHDELPDVLAVAAGHRSRADGGVLRRRRVSRRLAPFRHDGHAGGRPRRVLRRRVGAAGHSGWFPFLCLLAHGVRDLRRACC